MVVGTLTSIDDTDLDFMEFYAPVCIVAAYENHRFIFSREESTSDLIYYSSTGGSYTKQATGNPIDTSIERDFAVFDRRDGTVIVTWRKGTTIKFVKGTFDEGEITWGTIRTVKTSVTAWRLAICETSNGHFWIAYTVTASGVWATKSINDGVDWSAAIAVRTGGGTSTLSCIILPLSSSTVLVGYVRTNTVAKTWDGSSLGSEETIFTGGHGSYTYTDDGRIACAGVSGTDLIFKIRSALGVWGAEETISNDAIARHSLVYDPTEDEFHVFYRQDSDDANVKNIRSTGGVWGAVLETVGGTTSYAKSSCYQAYSTDFILLGWHTSGTGYPLSGYEEGVFYTTGNYVIGDWSRTGCGRIIDISIDEGADFETKEILGKDTPTINPDNYVTTGKRWTITMRMTKASRDALQTEKDKHETLLFIFQSGETDYVKFEELNYRWAGNECYDCPWLVTITLVSTLY